MPAPHNLKNGSELSDEAADELLGKKESQNVALSAPRRSEQPDDAASNQRGDVRDHADSRIESAWDGPPCDLPAGASRCRFNVGLTRVPGWKRPMDLLFATGSALALLPFAVVIAAWIKLFSHGSVIFRQERIGLRGKPFSMCKFRTMKMNAETSHHEEHLEKLLSSNGPMVKLDAMGDSRLIPGGRFLRATGLDELPQIINVLRGEMSIVGPRPCVPSELVKYKRFYMKRFNGLPGVTGMWQVNGKNETTFRRMIALDILYLRKMSCGLDLMIVARTVPAIFKEVFKCLKTRISVDPVCGEAQPRTGDAQVTKRKSAASSIEVNESGSGGCAGKVDI